MRKRQFKNAAVKYGLKAGGYLIASMIMTFGSCLTIKADIGINAWSALSVTVAHITLIKIGTLTAVMNGMCIVAQIGMERRRFPPFQLLQFAGVTITGFLLNFFVYTAFPDLSFSNYWLRIAVVLLGFVISAFGVMMVVEIDFFRTPLEALCQLIANRRGTQMAKIRQLVDVLSVAASLLLSLLFHCAFMVREGTLIGVLVFGPSMWLLRKPVRRILRIVKISAQEQ